MDSPESLSDVLMELLQDPGSPGSSSPPTPRASTPRFHPYAASSSSGRRLEEGALRRIVLTEEPYGAYYAFRLGTQTLLRREGSNLINGTKLLNAAGLTRGRRDALLKAEKEKHIVKSGQNICIGVWIPLERARELARKTKLEERIAPLLDDIPSLYIMDSSDPIPNTTVESLEDVDEVDKDVARALAEFRAIDRRSSVASDDIASPTSPPGIAVDAVDDPVAKMPTPATTTPESKSVRRASAPASVGPSSSASLSFSNSSTPLHSTATPSQTSMHSINASRPIQLHASTPVYYAPFPTPQALEDHTIPPYFWLAVPSSQSQMYASQFGLTERSELGKINWDLSKVPIYSLLP